MSINRGRFNSTLARATIGAAVACSAIRCLAQTAGGTQPTAAENPAPASAQNASAGAAVLEAIVVTASKEEIPGGLMRRQTAAETMSSISPAAIQERVAAASPLQLAATIPGVNFGSTDSYDLTPRDWVSMRGLDQTEIGWMIEGIPGVNPIVYYPYAITWADNENISDITVTPGNSRLQDPILTASGGEFIESIRTPLDTFGGMVSGSVGSYDGWRMFGDMDTGYIGQSGAKAFLSYSHTSADEFVGAGANKRDHVDFKVTEDWSPGAHSSLFISYNNWTNGGRIAPLNLTQAENGIATNLAQYQYPTVYKPGVNNGYYALARGILTNYLVASNNDFDVTDHITLHVTPYYRYGYINSPGEAALSPTTLFAGDELVTPVYPIDALQNGKVMAQADTVLAYSEGGVNTYLEFNLTPDNVLMVGYWHENVRQSEVSYYMPLDSVGEAPSPDEAAALRGTNGALIAGINFAASTATDELYMGDTQSMLDDKLQISAGLKYLYYSVHGNDAVIGAPPSFSAYWSVPMPRVLVSYDLDSHDQLYANVTTNARMPNVSATYVTEYNTTSGAISQLGNPATKPEYTVGGQLGYRYHGPVNLDVAAFYMNLSNHQIATGTLINGTVLNSALSAGTEKIKGASLELSTLSYKGFSVYGNIQYLDGTFADNIPIDGDFLPTRGKQMVESPSWISTVGGRYQNGPFFAEATAKYVAPQYTTFMNNQTMPSYTVTDLALGYHLPDLDGLKDPVIRVNLTNLGNKPYISSIASVTPTAVATTGINGRPIPASLPLYYVDAPFAAMVTLSCRF